MSDSEGGGFGWRMRLTLKRFRRSLAALQRSLTLLRRDVGDGVGVISSAMSPCKPPSLLRLSEASHASRIVAVVDGVSS